jgi:uncharacterized protein
VKINVLNIPEEGLELQFSLTENIFSDFIPDKSKFDFSLDGIGVSGLVRKTRQSIYFTGTAETVLKTGCSRCLEAAYLPLKAEFSYTLLPEPDAVKEDIGLSANDLDVGYYIGEVVDLDPVIFEQIMLQIPIKVLCHESCKGLCPHCGMNLNMGKCDCRSNFIDERLAVLKNLKL